MRPVARPRGLAHRLGVELGPALHRHRADGRRRQLHRQSTTTATSGSACRRAPTRSSSPTTGRWSTAETKADRRRPHAVRRGRLALRRPGRRPGRRHGVGRGRAAHLRRGRDDGLLRRGRRRRDGMTAGATRPRRRDRRPAGGRRRSPARPDRTCPPSSWSAPAVVLVHGVGVGPRPSPSLAAGVAAAGHRAVVVHRPGYGLAASEPAADIAAQVTALARPGRRSGLRTRRRRSRRRRRQRRRHARPAAGAAPLVDRGRRRAVVAHEPLLGPLPPPCTTACAGPSSALGTAGGRSDRWPRRASSGGWWARRPGPRLPASDATTSAERPPSWRTRRARSPRSPRQPPTWPGSVPCAGITTTVGAASGPERRSAATVLAVAGPGAGRAGAGRRPPAQVDAPAAFTAVVLAVLDARRPSGGVVTAHRPPPSPPGSPVRPAGSARSPGPPPTPGPTTAGCPGARLALVVAGWDHGWRRRATGPTPPPWNPPSPPWAAPWPPPAARSCTLAHAGAPPRPGGRWPARPGAAASPPPRARRGRPPRDRRARRVLGQRRSTPPCARSAPPTCWWPATASRARSTPPCAAPTTGLRVPAGARRRRRAGARPRRPVPLDGRDVRRHLRRRGPAGRRARRAPPPHRRPARTPLPTEVPAP